MRSFLKTVGLAVTTCGAVLFVTTGPAGAAVSGSDTTSGTVSADATGGGWSGGSPGIATRTNGPGSASGAGETTCAYQSLVLNDEGGIAPGGPTPGGWYSVTCTDTATGDAVTQTEWITTQPSAATPAVDPYSVAVEAEHSIRLPTPVMGSNPVGRAVVNLPTWLWIDRSGWHPYSVSASVGAVTATAVATPVAVAWSMGDGRTVTCSGPGTPFEPALPASQQSTSCSYTYQISSAGQPSPDGSSNDDSFVVRPTVTWAVSWTSVGVTGGGTLPALFTTTALALRVAQVESVNLTAAGPRRGGMLAS